MHFLGFYHNIPISIQLPCYDVLSSDLEHNGKMVVPTAALVAGALPLWELSICPMFTSFGDNHSYSSDQPYTLHFKGLRAI